MAKSAISYHFLPKLVQKWVFFENRKRATFGSTLEENGKIWHFFEKCDIFGPEDHKNFSDIVRILIGGGDFSEPALYQ